MSWPLLHTVLLAAIRDRFILSVTILLFLSVSLSVFMGGSAVIEKADFSLVFAAGVLRILGVVGLVLFTTAFLRRAFETKTIEFMLCAPVSRIQFFTSYALGFSMLAVFMTVLQGICIFILNPALFGEGHVLWLFSIMIENIIMVNVALFFAMVLSSASVSIMVTFSFYVLGRMMGQILGIIDNDVENLSYQWLYDILEGVAQIISAIMPRLDLMGQTAWLLYGVGENVSYGFLIIQGLVFCAVVILASLIDLTRREF